MKKFLCGVDIGGTKLSVGLVRPDGVIYDKITVYDHVRENETGIVEMIVTILNDLLKRNNLAESHLIGIGAGFPGHIRYKDGIVITTSNLRGFKNFPLRKALQDNFSIPVHLDNDANAQAFGEFKFGAGKGLDTMVFLTVSTGIGAGIILNNRLYHGMTGTAGEFGHTIVDPDSDLQCTCGNKGCLMACACGLALPHILKKKLAEGIPTSLSNEEVSETGNIDGILLKKGLDSGDPLSMAVILECADYIGIIVYNIFQVFNPPAVILGGGLLSWGEIYLNRIRTKFGSLARDMMYDRIEILESALGNDAGLIGAAALPVEYS